MSTPDTMPLFLLHVKSFLTELVHAGVVIVCLTLAGQAFGVSVHIVFRDPVVVVCHVLSFRLGWCPLVGVIHAMSLGGLCALLCSVVFGRWTPHGLALPVRADDDAESWYEPEDLLLARHPSIQGDLVECPQVAVCESSTMYVDGHVLFLSALRRSALQRL